MKKYTVIFTNNYGQVAFIVEAKDQENAINTAIGLKHAPQTFWAITAALIIEPEETSELDQARAILKKNGYLAPLWCKDDIRGQELEEGVEPLTEEEVEEIANAIERTHDANIGVNWEVIDYHIGEVIRIRQFKKFKKS